MKTGKLSREKQVLEETFDFTSNFSKPVKADDLISQSRWAKGLLTLNISVIGFCVVMAGITTVFHKEAPPNKYDNGVIVKVEKSKPVKETSQPTKDDSGLVMPKVESPLIREMPPPTTQNSVVSPVIVSETSLMLQARILESIAILNQQLISEEKDIERTKAKISVMKKQLSENNALETKATLEALELHRATQKKQ